MSLGCGCCEGGARLAPMQVANRPGLDEISYRIGTYATFFARMKARLSSAEFESLARLTTRDVDDPAMALLDAWSVVGDVLTFYQERIANEGYLRTASERRSILELARLVGYALRPGVAASVYLAYTLEPDSTVTIPAGSSAQSVPGPGELPQTFETADGLEASAGWNDLKPRQTQPQILTAKPTDLYLQGITTALKPNDPLLLIGAAEPVRRARRVEPQPLSNRTRVVLEDVAATAPAAAPAVDQYVQIVAALSKPPSTPPASSARLERDLATTFSASADTVPQLVTAFRPELAPTLHVAIENAVVTGQPAVEVLALRVVAAPFGHNAPLRPITDERGVPVAYEDWPLSPRTVEVMLAPPPRAPEAVSTVAARPVVGVTIKQGNSVDSAAKPLPVEELTLTVGGDKIRVAAAEGRVLFEFKSGRRVVIALRQDDAELTVDADVPRRLSKGQTAAYRDSGKRVSMQFAEAITVSIEAPGVPDTKVLPLNGVYDQILPGSRVVIESGSGERVDQRVLSVVSARRISKAEYGLTGQVTELTLDKPWLKESERLLASVRDTTVFAQSELLTLADEPISEPVCGRRIELDRLYADLESGRWLIVAGERTDVPATGIRAAELVMLAGVEQAVQVPPAQAAAAGAPATERRGDRTHSFLTLAEDLAYCYKRDTAVIYGNVVRATHGERKGEMLGHGDATRPFQAFTLKQPPLTYLAAPTAAGTRTTLEVHVNDVRWHDVDSMARLAPDDRAYVTRVDDEDRTTIVFGNGRRGARVPTGIENVRATYRVGIGAPGNVKANQITLLTSRPLGVKQVINPLRASGGADRETRDQARRNAPLGVMALDRLVSASDYEHFARTFAGIGKAIAVMLPRGGRLTVHLTIAGANDIPIDAGSDLYRNLIEALEANGDPHMPLEVVTRELRLLVLDAVVGFSPDYQWETVERQVRSTLLDKFGFERRQLGQDVTSSEVISAIHGVAGVDYVDLNAMDAITEALVLTPDKLTERMAALAASGGPVARIRAERASATRPRATQLIVISPDVADTVLLHGRKS